MSRLLKLYPRRWRQRYEEEVLAVVEQRPLSGADRLDLLVGAVFTWSRAAQRPRHRRRGGRTGRRLLAQAAVALLVVTTTLLVGNQDPVQSPVAIRAASGYNPAWQVYQTNHDYHITVDNIGKRAIPHLVVDLRGQRRWRVLSVSSSSHHAVRTLRASPFASTWDFGAVGRSDIVRITIGYTAIPKGSRLVFLSLHAYGKITPSGQPDPASQFFSLPCTPIFVEGPPAHEGKGPSLTRETRHGCIG